MLHVCLDEITGIMQQDWLYAGMLQASGNNFDSCYDDMLSIASLAHCGTCWEVVDDLARAEARRNPASCIAAGRHGLSPCCTSG